jgi:PAS domain S-box-containing protein
LRAALARIAFDALPQFVGVLTTAGVVLECNTGGLGDTGIARDAVVGKPFWEGPWWTSSPQAQAWLRDAVARAAAGESVEGPADGIGTTVSPAAEGHATSGYRVALRPLRDPDGEIVLLQAEVRTDEPVRAHHGTRAERPHSTTGTFRWDVRSNVVEADDVLNALFGFEARPSARPLGEYLDVVHPRDRATLIAAIERSAETNSNFELEYRVMTPDGGIRWISARARTFPGTDGRAAYMAGTCVDFTERKRVETGLRELNDKLERRVEDRALQVRETSVRLFESEQRFRLLVESVVDYAIFMLDAEGFITSWNSGAERIKGYRSEEIIGRHFSCFYTEEDRRNGLPKQVLARAAGTGKFEGEGWRVRKDGSRFWANVVVDAIVGPAGDVIGFAKVTRDLTEKRNIEAQLRQSQKMEAIGQLTGGVAHDFNNLLQVVLGSLEGLKRRADDIAQWPRGAEAQRFIDNALRGAERAASLTQRLLAFSRRQPLEPRPTDVGKLVLGMSDLLRRTLGESISIETVNAPDLWRVEVDANQLESALLNLAVNARDAMPEGGKLTIETANTELDGSYSARYEGLAPGEYVLIAVSDTGIGMDKEVLEKAFEPFFTTKEVGQGTGLGLSQVYGLVKQSGGHIRIYSEVGEGTTVKLFLPRLERDVEHEAPRKTVPISRSRAGETILVVEDDNDVRTATTEMLRELGYTVVTAAEGSAALGILASRSDIALLLTDVGLPGGMNGRQLADAAHALRPELPVLFATGYARNAIVHHGRLDAGIHLLVKPYTHAELASKLSTLLAQAEPPASPGSPDSPRAD